MEQARPKYATPETSSLILRRIDRAFGEADQDFSQVERNRKPMSGVSLEILCDLHGHRRSFTDMDAEFLDRVEFLQQARSARPYK